jgi:hypothetical protein
VEAFCGEYSTETEYFAMSVTRKREIAIKSVENRNLTMLKIGVQR